MATSSVMAAGQTTSVGLMGRICGWATITGHRPLCRPQPIGRITSWTGLAYGHRPGAAGPRGRPPATPEGLATGRPYVILAKWM